MDNSKRKNNPVITINGDLAKKELSMFDYVKVGIAVVDIKGSIVYINDTIVKNWGYSKDEFLGQPFSALKILTPKSILQVTANFAKRILGKEIGAYEIEIRTKKGETRIVEIASSLLKGKNKIVGIVATLNDITERRKSEDEIKKRNEELENFYKIAVGRELKIDELKKKVKGLEEQLNTDKRGD